MSSDSDNVYFAAKEGKETAATVLRKANMWSNQLYNNGFLAKLQDSWMSYYGAYWTSTSGGHKITFGGEQGELVQIGVNHYRNIATHILTMITASRPVMEARATNTDYKSLVQTRLANNLLDYYMREKRLEKYLKTATESAIVFGAGFIKMSWNSTTGEVYEINEETGVEIKEGDVEFENLSPFDVVFDTTKEYASDLDWVVCRSFKNKYDLAAKFPEHADRIKGLKSKSDIQRYRFDIMAFDETDDVPVYEFYHKRTEALPEGRYLMFVDSDIVLMDTPMPYRNLPVYRIAPSDILGTPYGYTPMFDLLPLQDAVNSLYSTILTNQHAFGVQNIYVPRGADISMKSLEGGLNIIEGNANAGVPSAMNLTQTPEEVFTFLKMIEQAMETVSGVSSVTRGNPEASLKSGTALALVQSTSLQFISGLQAQYVLLIEDVGTGLINMLKDFASVPRIAIISGKANSSFVEKEFTGDDLSQVNRVIVDVGNPLSRTTSGKVQMASELIQYGIIQSPKDYLTVLETGRLDAMTDETERELLSIRGENDRLSEGKPVRALAIDAHAEHILHHKTILSDPELRFDEELSQLVLDHIQEHIELMRSTDPGLLSVLGQQPLPPQGGNQPNPEAPTDQVTAQQPEMGPAGEVPPMEAPPGMPNLPQVPSEMLVNPELQQQALGNVE